MKQIQQELLLLMKQPEYVPLTLEELADALSLSAKGLKNLEKIIKQLLVQGTIARIKQDRYILPQDADLITGEIRFKQSGSALLIPEPIPNKPQLEPYTILAEDTLVAMHGDRVLACIIDVPRNKRFSKNKKYDSGEKFARVVRILQRGRDRITGTLQRARNFFYVIPDDPRIGQDILVEDPKRSQLSKKPKVGNKVVVHLIEWTERHLNPVGEIEKVLGDSHEPFAELDALLLKYNLDPEFSRAVEQEAAFFGDKVPPKAMKGRLDCRDLFTLSIDPDDAKDFDDALSLEYLENEHVRVGVHIADVSAYVKPHSQLDKEAQKRGNSTYLVGKVIPMLPHKLSSGLCSLIEGEDRLTKSIFLTFSNKGQLVDTHFANTIIRSNKRLTYEQAYGFMTKTSLNKIAKMPVPKSHQTAYTGRPLKELSRDELQQIKETVDVLWGIASGLRKERMQKGSLDLDMPEVKIYVDQKGYAEEIVRVAYDESHQLIEEFMLIANEMVAKALHEAGFGFISRVHDAPDPDKLDELREQMQVCGVRSGDLNSRPEMTRVLSKIKNHPQEHTLKIQLLRSLKQACYRAQADGHYGLQKVFYAHFTSPIRRYADLILHRVLDVYMLKRGLDTAPKEADTYYRQGDLTALAQHISITERNSVEAEREHVKIKLVEFFERENQLAEKRPFKAIITDVRNHGMFIELTDSMAFGMIHISTLKDDLYYLNSEATAMVGRRRGRIYKIGQEVEVIVERVDCYKRQIDFKLFEQKKSLSQENYLEEKEKDCKMTNKQKPKGRYTKKNKKKRNIK